ncbi:MAG: GNAT family N-acetyltransferase [Candidatus Staskawiczbacteria bacterium]|nr:GNAT family N-acetyltransferase [Candidatus Staskawiczbacteria bacterium]
METEINKKIVEAEGIKFFVEKDPPNGEAGGKKEVARAFLYIMKNDLHKEPFGFLEDLFVDESLRGQGIGTELINMVVSEAKKIGCYKLIANSRHEREGVHKMYEKAGFKNHGIEFKIVFANENE